MKKISFLTLRLIGATMLFLLGGITSHIVLDSAIMDSTILTFNGREVRWSGFLLVVFISIYLIYLLFEYHIERSKEVKREKAIVNEEKEKNQTNEKRLDDREQKLKKDEQDIYTKQNELDFEKQKLMEKQNELDDEIKKLNTQMLSDQGNAIFNLAMGLDTYEPVKYSMLEEAATQHNHAFAGIYLGNLYYSGLQKGEKIIVEKNYKLAFDMYMKAIENDISGVAYWSVGWMYEHGQAPGSVKGDTKSQEEALKYYRSSSELGYPKAHNSIGIFYDKKYAGLSCDSAQSIKHYTLADEGGDVYATLNLAYAYSKNKDEYDNAANYFKKAMEKGSPLAYLKFADFQLERFDYFKDKDKDLRKNILLLYCEAINLNNGDVSAKAYYHIGQLLKDSTSKFYQYKEEIITKLFLDISKDVETECYLRAYEILKNMDKQNVNFENATKELYAKLKKYFDKFEQDKENL